MGIIIIAEAGVNHNGSLELAQRLVLEAKKAGADYIKFQTFQPEALVSKGAQKADYQKKLTGDGETQLQMLKKLSLSYDNFASLSLLCAKENIGFLSTPFDIESIDFLETLNMDFWKIPSGEITNLPYLEKIGMTGKRVMMSTGMAEMPEIVQALNILEKSGTRDITLLHCNTQYPTPYEDVNLLAMREIADVTGKKVGYSDHTLGIEIPIAAAALGAVVIEKHFTLDRKMSGPDHRASLEPQELATMIRAIRNIERGLGDGKKTRTSSEKENCSVARKSIVAKSQIVKGEVFTSDNVTTKRPGTGISPMRWYEVIGKKAKRDYAQDDLLDEEEV